MSGVLTGRHRRTSSKAVIVKAPELGTQEGTDEGPHGQERKDIKEERSRFRNHDDGIPALCPAAHGLKCSSGQALRAGKALLPGAGSGLARCNEQGSADRVLAVTRKEHLSQGQSPTARSPGSALTPASGSGHFRSEKADHAPPSRVLRQTFSYTDCAWLSGGGLALPVAAAVTGCW